MEQNLMKIKNCCNGQFFRELTLYLKKDLITKKIPYSEEKKLSLLGTRKTILRERRQVLTCRGVLNQNV
jgi:hypothetical protein